MFASCVVAKHGRNHVGPLFIYIPGNGLFPLTFSISVDGIPGTLYFRSGGASELGSATCAHPGGRNQTFPKIPERSLSPERPCQDGSSEPFRVVAYGKFRGLPIVSNLGTCSAEMGADFGGARTDPVGGRSRYGRSKE